MAYTPRNPPTGSDQLLGWLGQEVRNIAAALSSPVEVGRLVELHKPPEKPRKGDFVLADGVDFNPGSGPGFYGFRGRMAFPWLTSDGLRKGLLNTPSRFESRLNCRGVDAKFLGPVSNDHFSPTIFNLDVRRFVFGLIGHRSPPAVVRLVADIILGSLNRMPRRWLLSHIVEERLKRLGPLLANRNASASVAWVAQVVLVAASALHPRPRHVLRRIGFVMCAAFFQNLNDKASARPHKTRPKMDGKNSFFLTTGAYTFPMSFFGRLFRRSPNDQKTPEFQTGQIDGVVRVHSSIMKRIDADWNPGSGSGFYGYRAGAWHFLG